jgi:hypothetical protein
MTRILSASILFCFILCSNPYEPLDYSEYENTDLSVELKVTGTAQTVSITFQNKEGGTSQISDVVMPWSYKYTGYPNKFYYISAQNNGETGTIMITVLRNGATYKTSTSSGAYVIATASGSL